MGLRRLTFPSPGPHKTDFWRQKTCSAPRQYPSLGLRSESALATDRDLGFCCTGDCRASSSHELRHAETRPFFSTGPIPSSAVSPRCSMKVAWKPVRAFKLKKVYKGNVPATVLVIGGGLSGAMFETGQTLPGLRQFARCPQKSLRSPLRWNGLAEESQTLVESIGLKLHTSGRGDRVGHERRHAPQTS